MSRCLILGVKKVLGLSGCRLDSATCILLVVSAVVVFTSFVVSAGDALRLPGEDLRGKVTGARAMVRGINPYTYPQDERTPVELVDPARIYEAYARTTFSPTILLVYATISGLPYPVQRDIWMVLEWAALLASILLLTRCATRPAHRLAVIYLGCFVFAGSTFWRLHVERGQYYVFLTLLLSLSAYLSINRPRSAWLPGVPLGFAVALRPDWLVMLPVIWAFGLSRSACAALASALLLVMISLPWTGLSLWGDFYHAVSAIDEDELGVNILEPAKELANPVVDGYDHRNGSRIAIVNYDTTLRYNLEMALGGLGLRRPTLFIVANWTWLSKALVGAIAAVFMLLAFWRRNSVMPPKLRLAILFLAPLTVDFLLPIRNPYANVLFLAPLALMLPGMLQRQAPLWVSALTISALLLSGALLLPTIIVARTSNGAVHLVPYTLTGRLASPASIVVLAGLSLAALWLLIRAQPAPTPAPAPGPPARDRSSTATHGPG